MLFACKQGHAAFVLSQMQKPLQQGGSSLDSDSTPRRKEMDKLELEQWPHVTRSESWKTSFRPDVITNFTHLGQHRLVGRDQDIVEVVPITPHERTRERLVEQVLGCMFHQIREEIAKVLQPVLLGLSNGKSRSSGMVSFFLYQKLLQKRVAKTMAAHVLLSVLKQSLF